MKFVKVDEDVVSVELSVDTLYTIGNALDLFVDVRQDHEVSTARELALANGFKTAYRNFTADEPVPAEEPTEAE